MKKITLLLLIVIAIIGQAAAQCTGSATLTVTISASPTAAFTRVITGTSVAFTNTSTAATTYLWNFGDGTPNSTLANPTHTYAPGTYTVTLTSTNACTSNTITQTITVGCPAATITTAAAGATAICAGSNVTLNATAGFASYQWYNAAGPISSATSTSYNATAAGSYYVVGSNAACTYTSSNIAVTINPTPIAAFTNSVSGLTATFVETATNETSYAWNFGNGNTSTLPNPTQTYAVAGTYTVTLIATGPCGSNTTSQTVTISCPALTVATAASGALTICSGSSVTLTATAGFASYQWYNAAGAIPGATAPTLPITSSGSYYVISTNGTCSYTSTSKTVTVNALAIASYTNVVSGLSVAFTETATGETSYAWNFGDGTTSTLPNPSHTYMMTGVYTVTLLVSGPCGNNTFTQTVNLSCPSLSIGISTASTSICAGSSTNLIASASFTSYQWYKDGFAIIGATSPLYSATASGIYLVIGSNASCSYTSSNTTITVVPAATAGFTYTASGSTIGFNETAIGETSYSWNFGDGGTSTVANPNYTYASIGSFVVTLTATGACGSSTTSQTIIIVCPTASITASAAGSTSLCLGSSVALTASSGFGSYQWYNGTLAISGATSPNYVASTAGAYSVMASNATCSYSSNIQNVIVNPLPTAGFSSSYIGLTVTLIEDATNETTYNWAFGDGSTSTLANPNYTYTTSGVYTITLTVSGPCGSATFNQIIDLSCPTLTASISAIGNVSFCVGSNVTLEATSGFSSYQWYNASGAIVGATSGSYSTTIEGDYYVVATNGICDYTSSPLTTFEIDLATSSFTFDTSGLSVVLNETASFESTYSWAFGDGSTSTLANPSHTYTTAGNYTVTLVTTGLCGSATATQLITVGCTASGITSIIESGPTTFCDGGTVTLTAPAGLTQIQWLLNNVQIAGQTTSVLNATQAGTYEFSGLNSSGCLVTSDSSSVVVSALPSINLGADTIVCNSYTLNATGFSSVMWSNGSTTPTLTVATTGVYDVIVTDANGCSNMDSVEVRIDGTVCNNTGNYLILNNPYSVDEIVFVSQRNAGYFNSVYIYNEIGQLINHYILASNSLSFSLPIERWARGTYFVRFDFDGESFTEKIVKTK